jgi:hypothetical protein
MLLDGVDDLESFHAVFSAHDFEDDAAAVLGHLLADGSWFFEAAASEHNSS